jgi:hypothetical protein
MLHADIETREWTLIRFQRSEGIGAEKCAILVGV